MFVGPVSVPAKSNSFAILVVSIRFNSRIYDINGGAIVWSITVQKATIMTPILIDFQYS